MKIIDFLRTHGPRYFKYITPVVYYDNLLDWNRALGDYWNRAMEDERNKALGDDVIKHTKTWSLDMTGT